VTKPTSVGIAMVSLGLHTFSDYGRQKRRLKIYAWFLWIN